MAIDLGVGSLSESSKSSNFFLKKKSQAALGCLKVFVDALNSGENLEGVASKEFKKKVVDVLNAQGRIISYGTFAGYLFTFVANQVKNSSSLSLANAILGKTNSVIVGTLYALAAVQNGYQLVKGQNFNDLLKKEDVLVLKGFIQSLFSPISSHLDQLKISWAALDPKQQESKKRQFKQKIQKIALNGLKIQALQLKQKDLEESLKDLQSNEMGQLLGITDQNYWQFNLLEAAGLIIDCHKTKLRNWTELKEMSGIRVAQKVAKAYRKGLLERVNSTDPIVKKTAEEQIKKLIGVMRVKNRQTKRIHSALLTINLLGTILSIAGMLTMPFGIGIAILVLSSLVAISSIGFKTYLFKKELLDTPCGKYDKALVITVAILLGLSLIALTGITLGFGLSLLQLGIALGIGGFLGGGFLGYYYHLLTQKDKLWKEAHPSLEVFQKFITDKRGLEKRWDDKVHALFKKLPKDLKLAIRQRYEKEDLPNIFTEKIGFSALKKTSKYFWSQWLIAGSEESRKLALEVQGVYDSLRLSKKEKNTQKNSETQKIMQNILQDQCVKEQFEKNRKYVFYRKESLSKLYEVTKAVSQTLLESPLSSTSCLRRSG